VSRILITAALLLTATSAWGQGYFGGSDGGMGRYHGVMPNPGPYRAINHDPATGRTYAREADYLTPKQHSRQGAENKTMTTLLLALILAAIVVCCPLLRRAVFAARAGRGNPDRGRGGTGRAGVRVRPHSADVQRVVGAAGSFTGAASTSSASASHAGIVRPRGRRGGARPAPDVAPCTCSKSSSTPPGVMFGRPPKVPSLPVLTATTSENDQNWPEIVFSGSFFAEYCQKTFPLPIRLASLVERSFPTQRHQPRPPTVLRWVNNVDLLTH
jgi:hypothetical protein